MIFNIFIILMPIIVVYFVVKSYTEKNKNDYHQEPKDEFKINVGHAPVVDADCKSESEDARLHIANISSHVSVESKIVTTESDVNPENDPRYKDISERTKYKDNMNCMVFEGNGLFLQTNRKRKIKIMAFSYDDAIDRLVNDGFDRNNISIDRRNFEPPTYEQLYAMNEHDDFIPENICKYDASYIIDRYMEDDKNADKELIDFATKRGLMFSYYIGQKNLINQILRDFSEKERIAFFILLVERDKTGNWNFENFIKYVDNAENLLSNEKFMNSYKRISNIANFENNQNRKKTACYTIASYVVDENI